MPTVRAGTVNVHFAEVGHGEPIVLVHSGPATSAQWRGVSDALKDHYRCLAIDLYGMGRTDPCPGDQPLTLDHEAQLVRVLTAACDRPVHLVGHSYGGAVSIRVMLVAGLGVRSLTLIEPAAYPVLALAGEQGRFTEAMRVGEAFLEAAEGGAEEEAWQGFLDYYNGPGSWKALPEAVRADFRHKTPLISAKWRALMSNPTRLEECRALSLPTLVLWGGQSRGPERRIAEILAAVVPGCRHQVLEGAGHMSPLTHPAEVSAAIRQHLERVSESS